MGCQDPVWQRGFYDHVCRREEEVRALFEYIISNPVRWELCGESSEWPWAAVARYPE